MITLKKIKRKIQKTFFKEQWSLLICDLEGRVLKQIVPPLDRIWADPFPIEHEGHYYIFIEQQYKNNNGTLGFIELFKDFSISEFTPILEKPYHLSWPQVFKIADTFYMIPETHENNSIDLYKAVNFPYDWVFEQTLIPNVSAVDTTLFFHEGFYYLFTSIKEGGLGLNDSLSLFYANNFPSSTWKAHPQNPVVVGKNNSRMAGKMFCLDGFKVCPKADRIKLCLEKTFRPSQDCVIEYGHSVVFNKIEELSPYLYRETFYKKILPEKELAACCTHTWNVCGDFVVRDIKTRKFLWS